MTITDKGLSQNSARDLTAKKIITADFADGPSAASHCSAATKTRDTTGSPRRNRHLGMNRTEQRSKTTTEREEPTEITERIRVQKAVIGCDSATKFWDQALSLWSLCSNPSISSLPEKNLPTVVLGHHRDKRQPQRGGRPQSPQRRHFSATHSVTGFRSDSVGSLPRHVDVTLKAF